MKALILAAGKGSRLYPATLSTPKPLMPIGGKETLYFIIKEILDNGINSIGIVVSEENSEEIEKFISNSNFNGKISLIIQHEQLGVAHAVKISQSFIRDEDFILYLGDNLFEKGIKKLIQKFANENNNVLYIKNVEDPRKFGVAVVDNDGKLKEIIEKPKNPPSKLAVTGIYGFKNNIFDYIGQISLSSRGEYEITDAIKLSIDNNDVVSTEIVQGWWIDTGNIKDYLDANKYKLLEEANLKKVNNVEGYCLVEDSHKIQNSIIKDYSFVGPSSVIKDSIIENCVILENSNVENYKLKNCILSSGTNLINKNSNMKIIENKII